MTQLANYIQLYIVHRLYVVTGSDPTNPTVFYIFYTFIEHYILTKVISLYMCFNKNLFAFHLMITACDRNMK
jgi:hypothetical protein